MIKYKRMYCKECKKTVKAENVKQVNHMLHILLTVLLGGLWLPVYALILVSGEKFACSECGSKKLKDL